MNIIDLQKPFGVFVVFRSVFLWQSIRCFCGNPFGVFVVVGRRVHEEKNRDYCTKVYALASRAKVELQLSNCRDATKHLLCCN